MSGNNYKSLKEQIGKLQTTNESLLKENSELKLMHSVNQDKLRDCFNKLETNDRELITSLTENKKFSRFNQDLQQENLILTKNLRDSETKNHDLYIECKEKQKIITHLQEQLSLHTNQNEAFKAKASHLESQIDDNEQFLHKVKQNEQNLLKTNNEFHQELEYSIKSMLDFYLNLDSNLKILLKNTEKSLEFIVKAQDLLVSKKRKNTETLINIFRDGLFFILESIEDSLFGLNEQMEISAKESTLKDNLERELKNMKREEIFSKNDEKELRREIENLAQSKNLSDKEKEKALNE